jgi:hypothetical protein
VAAALPHDPHRWRATARRARLMGLVAGCVVSVAHLFYPEGT